MAISEACGLWIEQRVREELESKNDTGISLREIGRTVAAEVEKYFEAKVDPMTITMKASRITSVTNVTPQENPTTDGISGVTSVTKTTSEIAKDVAKEVINGVPVVEAARIIAERTLKKESAIRQAYYRSESQYSGAIQLAMTAISYLERIREEDPERENAFLRVKTWFEKMKV